MEQNLASTPVSTDGNSVKRRGRGSTGGAKKRKNSGPTAASLKAKKRAAEVVTLLDELVSLDQENSSDPNNNSSDMGTGGEGITKAMMVALLEDNNKKLEDHKGQGLRSGGWSGCHCEQECQIK